MIRSLFIGAAIIGFIVNLYGDFSFLNQTRKTVQSGEWVNHSYEVSRAIYNSRTAVLQGLLKHYSKAQIEASFRTLSKLVKDTPSQSEKAQELEVLKAKELFAQENNPAISILGEMASAEDALLFTGLNIDKENNAKSLNDILIANAFDLLLVLLLLAFFFYEHRTSVQLRKTLAQTLFQVEESNAQLISTLAERDAKFKTVVHDLKNPLGAIRGFAELIFDDSADHNSVVKMASVIQRVSNDTLNLVASVLESADQKESSAEQFDIFETLNEVCSFLQPVATEKSQKIQISKSGNNFLVLGRKRQVQDVFYNLIGNAIKFSPAYAVVTVNCASNRNALKVQIKDEGPGFSDEDFANLFMPGAKLSARPTGGEVSNGYGLYSAKQAATDLGGNIEINNNANRGACVNFIIPVAQIKKPAEFLPSADLF